jgi:hypothetical protein
MNTNTAKKYLAHAIEKTLAPLHANFAAALKAGRKDPERLSNREITLLEIRHVLGEAHRLHPTDPKLAVAKSVAYFAKTKNTVSAVVLVKELMKDCAFQANLDVGRLNRLIDAAAIEDGVDAMLEEHPVDTADIPLFDQSSAERVPPREDYAGPEQDIIATSIEDAIDAISYLQIWLVSGFSKMSVESQQFWGFDNGLCPLDQEANGDGTFTPVYELDAYRQLQKDKSLARRNSLGKPEDVEKFMMSA